MIYKCTECGKQWDDDGCRVSLVSGVFEEVEYFTCEGCKKVSE